MPPLLFLLSAHDKYGDGDVDLRLQLQDKDFLVSMARVAQVSGLCWNDDEATKLCVHPKYGTWHAFRAVVVDLLENGSLCTTNTNRGYSQPIPPLLECPVSSQEILAAKKQMQVAIQLSNEDGSGVDHGKDDMTKTAKSLGKYRYYAVCHGTDWSLVSPSMRAWIALRDSFSLGRDDFMYSESQLLYHYTKDPGILKREILQRLDS